MFLLQTVLVEAVPELKRPCSADQESWTAGATTVLPMLAVVNMVPSNALARGMGVIVKVCRSQW